MATLIARLLAVKLIVKVVSNMQQETLQDIIVTQCKPVRGVDVLMKALFVSLDCSMGYGAIPSMQLGKVIQAIENFLMSI